MDCYLARWDEMNALGTEKRLDLSESGAGNTAARILLSAHKERRNQSRAADRSFTTSSTILISLTTLLKLSTRESSS